MRPAARGGGGAGRRSVGRGARLMHPFPLAGAIGDRDLPRRPLPAARPHDARVGHPRGDRPRAVGFGIVEPPNLTGLIEDVGTKLGKWTYLLVGTLAFLETGAFIGLIAPGESAVLVGGVVAGQGEISIVTLIGLVWFCAVAGDLTSYTLGRRLGRGFLERHGPRLKITEDRLQTVEGFFDRHGGPTILIGRFIGLVRALAPFIAGASKMELRRFLSTTSSARACGRRCSASSATSSGSRSAPSRSTSAPARRPSRAWWWWFSRSSSRCGCGATPRCAPDSSSGSTPTPCGSACAARSCSSGTGSRRVASGSSWRRCWRSRASASSRTSGSSRCSARRRSPGSTTRPSGSPTRLHAGRRRHPQRAHAPRLASGDPDRHRAHRGLGDPHAQRHPRGPRADRGLCGHLRRRAHRKGRDGPAATAEPARVGGGPGVPLGPQRLRRRARGVRDRARARRPRPRRLASRSSRSRSRSPLGSPPPASTCACTTCPT